MEEKPKIIGYDAKRVVRNATGLGNYGRTLLNEMVRCNDGRYDFRLYVPDAGRADLRSQLAADDALRFVLPDASLGRLRRAWWRLGGMTPQLVRDGVRLFHGLSGELPHGLRRAGIRSVLTVHDLIFLRHPEFYPPIDALLYKYKLRVACREANRFIAISECTKNDLIELADVAPERIDVIYQGCEPVFAQPVAPERLAEVRARYRLPAEFVLTVGSIEERKNALLTLQALRELPGVQLVLVGKRTPYTARLERYAAANGLSERLHLLHDVPFADLPAVYRCATVFAYPSRYEGFGIPLIEALNSGVPVVAATGSCLEEAGGDAQFYVGPDDVAGMVAALRTLFDDEALCRSTAEAGRRYAARFNGQQAEKVMAVYEKTFEEGRTVASGTIS